MPLTRLVVTAGALTCCLIAAGCGASTGPAAPTGSLADSPTPGPDASPTAILEPTAMPLATLESAVEKVTEQPPDAIGIEMSYEGIDPRFTPSEVSAETGTVVLFLHNTGSLRVRHDFNLGPAIGQVQARMPSIGGGSTVVLTLENVPPGTYTFWCSIESHYRYGMVGTLAVAP